MRDGKTPLPTMMHAFYMVHCRKKLAMQSSNMFDRVDMIYLHIHVCWYTAVLMC